MCCVAVEDLPLGFEELPLLPGSFTGMRRGESPLSSPLIPIYLHALEQDVLDVGTCVKILIKVSSDQWSVVWSGQFSRFVLCAFPGSLFRVLSRPRAYFFTAKKPSTNLKNQHIISVSNREIIFESCKK